MAQKARQEGYERVLVVGGDGLFSKAVNGYLRGNARADALSFGLIPCGSGNDFARSFGIPFRFEKAVEHFQKTAAVPIDVCKIDFLSKDGKNESSFFVNAAGLGCIPVIVGHFNRLKRLRYAFMYSLISFVDTYAYDSRTVRIESGSKKLFEGPIRWVSVTNGKFAGGGIAFGERDRADDGQFQVKILHSMSKWKTPFFCTRFAWFGMKRHPNIADFFLKSVRLTAAEGKNVPLEADGEVIGRLPAKITLLPGRLRFHG